jgi:single-stranded-DNA-specific exonuclease
MSKKWVPRTAEQATVAHLQEVLKIDELFCKLLAQRGISTFEEAKSFFRPSVEHLHDPFLMKDMDKAVARLQQGIERNEKILLYGDYDVDGTTSVAMMYSFLQKHHVNLQYYIPDRYNEGYGISFQSIEFAKEEGITLVIAMDCGIKAMDKIAKANEYGIDFIICDHHLPADELPQAVAVLDPKRNDCTYPYKELSGCGVAFKLVQACIEKMGFERAELNPLLDLVVISIACDIVPMTGENRVLAYFGLKILNRKPRVGLRALIHVLGKEYPFSISDIVFGIGPSINAAGRLSDAKLAVQLLLSTQKKAALQIAQELKNKNDKRKELETEIAEDAKYRFTMQSNWEKRNSIVVFHKDWHKGVVGIVAARLAEYFQRPSIVLTASGDTIVGSARTVANFDLHQAISNCETHLVNYGGHRHAAGLTLTPQTLEAFKADFEKTVADNITEEDLTPIQHIDAEIDFNQITNKFLRILNQFAPFGPQNRRPVFATYGVKDTGESKVLKKTHLRFSLQQEEQKQEGIGFGMGYLSEEIKGKSMDICYVLEENTWRGKRRLQLRVKDLKV